MTCDVSLRDQTADLRARALRIDNMANGIAFASELLKELDGLEATARAVRARLQRHTGD